MHLDLLSIYFIVGGGGNTARFSLFFFPVFSRPRAGLATLYKVVFRVGNQYAECEKQPQQTATTFFPLCGMLIRSRCVSSYFSLNKNCFFFFFIMPSLREALTIS